MRKVIWVVIVLIMAYSLAYGSPSNTISVPNSFTPLTTIQSSQTNDNNNEIQSKYNAHTHTDITQVGTVVSGTWNGSAVARQYGGTGANLSSNASGSIVMLSGSTAVAIPPPTAAGQVLTTKTGSTSPQWGSGANGRDMIVRGYEITVPQPDAPHCVVEPGVLFHGSTEIDKTSGTVLTLATAADWSSGSVIAITNNWNYIGVDSSGNIKLLGNLPPNRLDTSGNNATGTVVKVYSYDGTTYWRVVGAIKEDASSNIDQYFQDGNFIMWDVPVTITTTVSAAAWSAGDTCISAMPLISTRGLFGLSATHAGSSCGVWIRPYNTTWTTTNANGIYDDSSNWATGGKICKTDRAQRIQHYNDTGDTNTVVSLEGFFINIR